MLKAYANYDAEIGYIQGMNYIAALMLYYIDDEETVFWCLYQLMVKNNWRETFINGLPKLFEMCNLLEDRLSQEFPELFEYLDSHCIGKGTFTGLFVSFGLDHCPLEISTRLFEVFLLDGEDVLVRVYMKMIELKQEEIFKIHDGVELQRYIR